MILVEILSIPEPILVAVVAADDFAGIDEDGRIVRVALNGLE